MLQRLKIDRCKEYYVNYICVKLRVTVELKRIELLWQFGTVYLIYNDVYILRIDINSILTGKHTRFDFQNNNII